MTSLAGVWSLAAAAVLIGVGRPIEAQLTLGDAMRAADRSAYVNRIATANAAAGAAQALAPLKGVLPNVRFEAGYLRTTDPIGVFGSTLRQRDISSANFDPQRLNHPDATTNVQGGIVLEQPLLNPDAWAARRAALAAASAGDASADWSRLATRVDVIRAYYGVALAAERLETLRSAARAAHAHVSQAEAMVRQGLATKSDALLASVRAGDVDAQLAEAEAGVANSRRGLAVLLGGGGDATQASLPVASSSLPPAERIRAVVASDTAAMALTARADVRAASNAANAARGDATRARLVYAPRINAFARYDWNSPARVYAGEKNWTVGVMASWNVFAGAGDIADVRASGSRAAAAEAQAAAAEAAADLQAQQTRTSLVVALTRLSIAEQGVSQSAEARRIVARKYEGGLATVVELLDAQAAETQTALALSQTRWAAIVADAERLLALGRDPAALQALDTPGTVAALTTAPDSAHR